VLSVVESKATAVTLKPAIIPSTLKIFDKKDLLIFSRSWEIKYPHRAASNNGKTISKKAFFFTVRM
tara:strand:+ start:270 stop:467 length:198 start_codon:yes stop_codon:yes gene_type:complete